MRSAISSFQLSTVISQLYRKIAASFSAFDSEISHIGIRPDERMERFDVRHGRSVLLAAINAHRTGLAHLDRDDARRGIGAEEQRVFLQSSIY